MEDNFEFTNSDLARLLDQFREMKHDINNSIAVLMALAELAQQNPAHYKKLSDLTLSRCPAIVEKLLAFQKKLGEKLAQERLA